MAMPVGIPHFEVHGDVATRDTRWKKWHSNFERAIVGYDMKDPTRKRALLLFYGDKISKMNLPLYLKQVRIKIMTCVYHVKSVMWP